MSFSTCRPTHEPISSPFPTPPQSEWSISNRLKRAALPPIQTQNLPHYELLAGFDKARCRGAIIPTLDTPFLKDYRVFRDELQLLTEYFMAIEELDETCPYTDLIHTVEQLRDAYYPKSSKEWRSDRRDCFGGLVPSTRHRIIGLKRSPHSNAKLRKRHKVLKQMRKLHVQVTLAYESKYPTRPPPKSPMEFYERPEASPTSPYASPTESQFCHRLCDVPQWTLDDKGNYHVFDSLASTSTSSLIADIRSPPEADDDSSMRAMHVHTPTLDTPPLESNWSPAIYPETTQSNGHETGTGADVRLSTRAIYGTPTCGDVSLEDTNTSPGPEERDVKGSGCGVRKGWNSFASLVSLLSPKKLVPKRRSRSRSSDKKRTPGSE